MLGRRRGGWVIGVLVGAVLLAACGNDFQFVNNSAEGNFFKVPNGWQIYPLTEQDTEGRPPKLPVETQRIWHVAFDAAKQPDQGHLQVDRPIEPVGEAQIYALSSSDN